MRRKLIYSQFCLSINETGAEMVTIATRQLFIVFCLFSRAYAAG